MQHTYRTLAQIEADFRQQLINLHSYASKIGEADSNRLVNLCAMNQLRTKLSTLDIEQRASDILDLVMTQTDDNTINQTRLETELQELNVLINAVLQGLREHLDETARYLSSAPLFEHRVKNACLHTNLDIDGTREHIRILATHIAEDLCKEAKKVDIRAQACANAIRPQVC